MIELLIRLIKKIFHKHSYELVDGNIRSVGGYIEAAFIIQCSSCKKMFSTVIDRPFVEGLCEVKMMGRKYPIKNGYVLNLDNLQK